jgi:uncharacterized metal-binding protein
MKQPSTAKSKICLLPCAGLSSVGQLTRHAVQELVLEGKGEWLTCTQDADLQIIILKLTDIAPFVVVDGCEQHCVKKRLEAINCKFEFHLCLADLGIEKTESAGADGDELQLVKDAIVAECSQVSERPPIIMTGCSCG